MKRTLVLLFALCITATAQSTSKQQLSERGTCAMTAAFSSNGNLRLHIRSGDVRVEGSEGEKIVVSCQSRKSQDLRAVHISFTSSGKDGDLNISGGPHNDLQIVVQIPKRSNLWLRMPAGELHVKGVRGSKDVEVHAGDVTVDVGHPDDYDHVDASVNAGELDADAFHINKGGLFRSFSRSGPGNFRMHAHVGAGQLTLTANGEKMSSL